MGKIIHDTSIDVNLLAKTTTSFTGADIENVVNQAALKAAIEGSPMVQMHHLEEARNRLIMGISYVFSMFPVIKDRRKLIS